jgi:hypothetical protein
MKKIRPTRIANGIFNALSGKSDTERLSVCEKCPKLTKTRQCDMCGCFVDAKTTINQEYCPMNKWSDIKILEEQGVALRIESTKAKSLTLDVEENTFVLNFGKLKQGDPTNTTLMLINDRSNFIKNTDKITLNNIEVKPTCGCTVIDNAKVAKLRDGEDMQFTVSYNSHIVGEFSKVIKVITDETLIKIVIKGEVRQ